MDRNIKYFFCAGIFALLVLPNIGLLKKSEESTSCEKRSLQEWPEIKMEKQTVSELESYYRDHASLRNQLQQLQSKLKQKLFNSSSKPTEIVIGKNNWLYYSSVSDKLIDSYARKDLWSEQELKSKAQAWDQRKEKLAQRNKIYHVAIWPNKPTIYPEHLPNKMKRIVQDTTSKTDQILNYCTKENSSVKPLDVRALLSDKKKQHKVYHQHDSHWNALGAFYAYQALMNDLGIEPYKLEDFNLEWKANNSGDLTALMGLCNDTTLSEEIPVLTFKGLDVSKKLKPEKGPSYFMNQESKSDQTVLVFRDSYLSAMIPYLSLHFRKAYYPWSYYDQNMVDQLDADIIISANVERRL